MRTRQLADQVVFGADIASYQLWFNHVGLEVSLIGTTDKITVQDWYADTSYHVEQFHMADGNALLDADVENLVSAMSAFSVTVVGQATLTAHYARCWRQTGIDVDIVRFSKPSRLTVGGLFGAPGRARLLVSMHDKVPSTAWREDRKINATEPFFPAIPPIPRT